MDEATRRGYRVLGEVLAVVLIAGFSFDALVAPALASLHPTFAAPVTGLGLHELPETPRGWALTAYLGLAVLAWLLVRLLVTQGRGR